MAKYSVDLFSSFDELYEYWKKVDDVRTPFTAIILSTEIAGLDKRVTHFVIDHHDELNDMSGKTCAIFMATPRKNIQTFFANFDRFTNGYREVSYSIARLLGVTADQFPSIVFFDNLIRSKDIVTISLEPILGPEPTDEKLATFFRSLFVITDNVADSVNKDQISALQQAIDKKWQAKKLTNVDFSKTVATTMSVANLSKTIIEIITQIVGPLRDLFY